MKYSSLLLVVVLLLASCKTKDAIISVPETEYRSLDTMVIAAPTLEAGENPTAQTYELERYNPSHKRINDLLHTKLELKFDWEKEQVIGKATLKLKPYFYPTDSLILDAKGFVFNAVRFVGGAAPLQYQYDGQQIKINLGRTFTRDQEYYVFIDYVATPAESGGSNAITSDKGLFFINPRGEEGSDKPQQIWTQGETENNSRWFPTIDKPNERTTQEMYLTVQDKYKTLSNGILESSTKNPDGTRTDYWNMDLPHAPYLFMIAIGDFAIVEDDWNGMLVDYYVEPQYEAYARDIFPYTPEMLSFFSDKLIKYPWQKYSQVVVRDFVSGAMENTTGVIFGEFMNGTDRELVDNLTNEKIVAHELMHHWFGDYVTTESWANLTLNEGFANYSEYMWLEEKHGVDEADYHRMSELSGYLSSAQSQGIHPLIHYGYDDKEDMFDAHSYNYGGLVLHMLRNYIGEDAFFTTLKKYLNDNAYTPVEVHELRMAFEDVTGEDLHWFFDQWFMEQGHPELDVTYDYDVTAQLLSVRVKQSQDPTLMPAIFQLPLAVDIYNKNGQKTRENIFINQREQVFTFAVTEAPALVNFDADRVLLGVMQDNKTEENYIFQYQHAPKFMDRIEAIEYLSDSSNPDAIAILRAALKDNFYAVRGLALQNLDVDDTIAAILQDMARNDTHSQVRGAALAKLAETGDAQYLSVAEDVIQKDKSYDVVAAGLEMLYALDSAKGLSYAKQLEKENNSAIMAAIGSIYAGSSDKQYLNFFEQNWNNVQGYSAISFIDNYGKLVATQDIKTLMNAADNLQQLAINMGQSPWRRFAATKVINDLHGLLYQYTNSENDEPRREQLQSNDDKLLQMISTIKATETNGQLKGFYSNFPNPPARP
ncbi:MAG: M1 family aminopeptidase [Bacteroidota bacterium]